jgi:putative transposase
MGRLTHRTSLGSTYFVTRKAWQSISVFQVTEITEILIAKALEYRDEGNYSLHEFVPMPNHLHLLLTPADSISLEKVIQLIKGGSSHEIHKVRGNSAPIWQSGFHESSVRDWDEYKARVNYIDFNPVVAKLVARPEDWPYGSASGKYQLDAIPQGLKPKAAEPPDVGPKGPTPKNTKTLLTKVAKAKA